MMGKTKSNLFFSLSWDKNFVFNSVPGCFGFYGKPHPPNNCSSCPLEMFCIDQYGREGEVKVEV